MATDEESALAADAVDDPLTGEGRALDTALAPLGQWGSGRIGRQQIPLVDHQDAEAMPRP